MITVTGHCGRIAASAIVLCSGLLLSCTTMDAGPEAADSLSLSEQFPVLSQTQLAFISSQENLDRFSLTTEKIAIQLSGRDEDSVVAYVDALMDVAASAAFQPGQDSSSPIKADDIG